VGSLVKKRARIMGKIRHLNSLSSASLANQRLDLLFITLPVSREITRHMAASAATHHVFENIAIRVPARIFTISRLIRVTIQIQVAELVDLTQLNTAEAREE